MPQGAAASRSCDVGPIRGVWDPINQRDLSDADICAKQHRSSRAPAPQPRRSCGGAWEVDWARGPAPADLGGKIESARGSGTCLGGPSEKTSARRRPNTQGVGLGDPARQHRLVGPDLLRDPEVVQAAERGHVRPAETRVQQRRGPSGGSVELPWLRDLDPQPASDVPQPSTPSSARSRRVPG